MPLWLLGLCPITKRLVESSKELLISRNTTVGAFCDSLESLYLRGTRGDERACLRLWKCEGVREELPRFPLVRSHFKTPLHYDSLLSDLWEIEEREMSIEPRRVAVIVECKLEWRGEKEEKWPMDSLSEESILNPSNDNYLPTSLLSPLTSQNKNDAHRRVSTLEFSPSSIMSMSRSDIFLSPLLSLFSLLSSYSSSLLIHYLIFLLFHLFLQSK